MITDKDITKLKSVFATKEDLKTSETGIRNDLNKFATKEYLKKSETGIRNDLKRFATKNDLKRFATKDDLDKSEIRTAKSFEGVQKQISNLEHKVSNLEVAVSTLQEDVTDIKHNMLTMEDNILGAINKLQVENSITASYRHKIQDHEQRICKLEKLQFAN